MAQVAAAMTVPSHTVLIVDDEPSILSALRRTLRTEPVRVLTTTQPEEALALIDRESVDLLISDIDMPQMSGLDLVARVRRSYPNVVRMLLTGNGSLDAALRAINDGEVFRFLTKPWQDVELRATIAQALERLDELRRSQAAARTAERRRRMFSELDREHPGITTAAKEDGVYRLSAARLKALRTLGRSMGILLE